MTRNTSRKTRLLDDDAASAAALAVNYIQMSFMFQLHVSSPTHSASICDVVVVVVRLLFPIF